MRKKTFADVVLEAEMLPYSREGYAFFKEAAELGLRGKYIENLLYKEAHRDILEAQELMLQESFFMESESVSDLTVLLEEAEQANESFMKRLFKRLGEIWRVLMKLLESYSEQAKANKERIDEILTMMRQLQNFDSIGVSQEEILKNAKEIWASKGNMAEAAKPASKQEIPGVGSEELKSYIGVALSVNYVNLVIDPAKRFSGVVSLDELKELLNAVKSKDADYAALDKRLDEMVAKTHEGGGVKITLVGAIIDQVKEAIFSWVNTTSTKAIEDKKDKKDKKDEPVKEFTTIDEMLMDDQYMEHVALILEDAANASGASKFGQRLIASMSKYMDLVRCITNFKEAFQVYFIGVLNKKDGGSSPAKKEEDAPSGDEGGEE